MFFKPTRFSSKTRIKNIAIRQTLLDYNPQHSFSVDRLHKYEDGLHPYEEQDKFGTIYSDISTDKIIDDILWSS